MGVLVIAEHDNAELKPATLNTVTAGLELGEVTVLVAGNRCRAVAEAVAGTEGVQKVLLSDGGVLEHPLAETLAPLVQGLADGFGHLLAPATSAWKQCR